MQFILKEFDSIAALIDNLVIWYFQNNIKLFIRAQLDKKNRDLDNGHVIIKQAVDAKSKIAWQAPLLVQKSDAHYSHSQKYLKNEESKDPKNSKAKKNYLSAHNNSRNRNRNRS